MTDQAEYIFCMHPSPDSSLYKTLDNFWKSFHPHDGENRIGDTEKYPYSIELTSFFTLDTEQDLQEVIDIATHIFSTVDKNLEAGVEMINLSSWGASDLISYFGFILDSPTISGAITRLLDDTKKFNIKGTLIQPLNMTLYGDTNMYTDDLKNSNPYIKILEDEKLQWEDTDIILWETNYKRTCYRNVHTFSLK